MGLEITLGIIMMLLAVVVVVLVIMQTGKEKSLSGTIAGAGESFFSKNKGKTKEKTLSIITTILTVIFALLAVILVIVIAVREPVASSTETTAAILNSFNKFI